MKTTMMMLALALMVSAAHAADGASTDAKTDAKTDAAKAPEALSNQPKKKTTDVSFEDVLVQGKYHFSDEAVTTVEQDKILDALLGVRTDFKDRLKKSSARH
jgi:uncharacterized protein (DUF305 family)